MKRILLSITFLLFISSICIFVVLLASQTVFAQERLSRVEDPVTLAYSTDKPLLYTLTNHKDSAITGFFMEIETSAVARVQTYHDVYVNYSYDTVILKDTPRTLKIPIPPDTKYDGEYPKVILKAALYADGSSWGEDYWVEWMEQLRNASLAGVRHAIETLQNIQDKKLSKEDAVAFIKQEQQRYDEDLKSLSSHHRNAHSNSFRMILTNIDLNVNHFDRDFPSVITKQLSFLKRKELEFSNIKSLGVL